MPETAGKKQRWFCQLCRRSFSWSTTRHPHYRRQFVWFKRWITEGYTMKQLAHHSGYHRSTIERIVGYYLAHPPHLPATVAEEAMRYLICDGTFLQHRYGMYAAMEGIGHQIIHASYGINEGPRDMLSFCSTLREEFGLRSPKSITIDGNPHIFRAVGLVWPEMRVQRCLVHIQRQGLSWCRQHPKRADARALRRLFFQVLAIHTADDQRNFLHEIALWEKRYGLALCQRKTPGGWVTSDLQRARSMLLKALPYMFAYLDDPLIPRSTNALEGYFSRLKQRYRQHRGLSIKHRKAYFQWYFQLCPR